MVYRRRLVRCLDKVCFMSFDHWVTIGPPANSIIAWTHRSCVRWNKWHIIFCWSGLTHRSSEKAPRMKCFVIGTNGMRSTQTVTTRYDLNHLHCYLTSLSFHKMQLQKMQLSKSTSKQDRQDPQFIPDANRCALKQQKQPIRMTTTLGKVVDTVLTFACKTNHPTLPLGVWHFFCATQLY